MIRYFFFSSLGIFKLSFWRLSFFIRHVLFPTREACQSEGEGERARASEAAPRGAGQGPPRVGATEEEGAGAGALPEGEVRPAARASGVLTAGGAPASACEMGLQGGMRLDGAGGPRGIERQGANVWAGHRAVGEGERVGRGGGWLEEGSGCPHPSPEPLGRRARAAV